jgi:sulfatase maturation enzyme AslB (radical SAM superfamily)
MFARLMLVWKLSRPVQEEEDRLYERRFSDLPENIKTKAQLLGRTTVGCEGKAVMSLGFACNLFIFEQGTHGVFPKCNFSCRPCYHSRDANLVEVDGVHTLENVSEQMAFAQSQRGNGVHCQLIGGEASLLPAEYLGKTLRAMLELGRIPMVFSHGDFGFEQEKRSFLSF